MAVYYPNGGPGAYQQQQQARGDDDFRSLLQMMMMGMQQKNQERRYQDTLTQQKTANELSRKKYELDVKEAGDRGEYYRGQVERWNKPEAPDKWSVQVRAVLDDPSLTQQEKMRFVQTGGKFMSDKERFKMEQEAKRGDPDWERRYSFFARNHSPEDSAMMASGMTPPSVTGERKTAEIKATTDAIAGIDALEKSGKISPEQAERERAVAGGTASQYYTNKRSEQTRRSDSVVQSNKAYQNSMLALSKMDEKERPDMSQKFRSMGVYTDFPKKYTTAAMNIEKGVATKEEVDMMATLDYLYGYMDRGGDLDDLSFKMVEGMDNATVLRFRRMYQKKYNPETYK